MPATSKPDKHVLIVGGAGGMGLWAGRHWFSELADVAHVTLCDIRPLPEDVRRVMASATTSVGYLRCDVAVENLSSGDWSVIESLSALPAVPPAPGEVDLVVIAVPIPAIRRVTERLGPQLPPDTWLIDMGSVKGPPVEQMLRGSGPGVAVAGTHPLFGVTGGSMAGRTVVLVPTGRDGEGLCDWLDSGLRSLDAAPVRSTAELHDRYMLIAQTMTHFALLVFGEAVTQSLREGESLAELRRFGTPPYLAMGNVTGRLLAQDPRLYAAIQGAEGADDVREAFARAARRLADSFHESPPEQIEAEIGVLAERYGADELALAARMSELVFRGIEGRGGRVQA